MKFYVHTTGCKANQWDSYMISKRLKEKGLIPAPLIDTDIIIINACTVTENAERDIRRFINHARNINGDAKIILTGCHAQVYPERNFDADLIVGNYEKFNLEKWVHQKGSYVENARIIPIEKSSIDGLLPAGKTRFFFKIQDGCNQFCTYCIVPYARGIPRSRPIEEIIEALKALKMKGIQEVVLTGIELSLYRDPSTGKGLSDLLYELENSETPQRIRISSINPLYIDDRFIDIVSRSCKITKHLHIPLQSGSDRILEKMGRRYTRNMVVDIIDRLHNAIKDVAIGMDIIAGFPSEDDSAFMETYRLIEIMDIYYLHVFPYSLREGTTAASMTPAVPDFVKRKRVQALRQLDAIKRKAFYMRFLERRLKILPEGKKYSNLFMKGYTDNYIPVYIPFKKNLVNHFTDVIIKELQGNILLGRVL